MKRIGMGLVGPGFVGTHHIDAVRRLGFVDVVAIAASSGASARRKADALGVPNVGSVEALVMIPTSRRPTPRRTIFVPVILRAAGKAHDFGQAAGDDRWRCPRAADAANNAGVVTR
jgi:hypothetical protein